MNPQEQKAGNRAAANLGFATSLQELLMSKMAPQTPETAPQQEQTPTSIQEVPTKEAPKQDEGARIAELELSITKKLDDIRQELKGDHKKEVDALKKQIEDALKE